MANQEAKQALKPISEKKVLGKHSRRQFLRNGLVAALAGGVTAAGVHKGGKAVEQWAIDAIAARERDVRALGANLKAVYGVLEHKIAAQTADLEKKYTQGNLRIYEQLGIATPADLEGIAKLIENNKEFEKYYGVTERLRELKDRAEKSITDFEAAEKKLPQAQQNLNDRIRRLLGKPTGKQGQEYRQSIRDRLTSLVTVYDTNENNKRGFPAVMDKLTEAISRQNISAEEKEFLTYFRAEFEAAPDKKAFLEVVRSYAPGDRKQAIEKLEKTIEEGEKVFAQVKENKVYLERMQGLLKDGIAVQEDIRKQSVIQFQKRKNEIDASVGALKAHVDGIVTELQAKGYDFETREQEINRGTFTREVADYFDPLVKGVAGAAGILTGLLAFLWGRKRAVARAGRNAVKEVVTQYNQFVPQYNELLETRNQLAKQNQDLAQKVAQYEAQTKTQTSGEGASEPKV